EQRDRGGMIEVAGGETARELPVVALVGHHRHHRGERESHERSPREDEHGVHERAVGDERVYTRRDGIRRECGYPSGGPPRPAGSPGGPAARPISAATIHTHTIHDTRSTGESVTNRFHATAGSVAESATRERSALGLRRSITCTAWRRAVRMRRWMASSSESGVSARHPGMRNTLHATAVRPHP